jgi:hypothetical protein
VQVEQAALGEADRRIERLRQERGLNAEVDRQVDELFADHQRQLVEYGAAGRLAMKGELAVLPLEDEVLLEQARPTGEGTDPAKLLARHDFIVRQALKAGPTSLLILGGAHDLSDSVRRLGGETTEYVRVTTTWHNELAERNSVPR